MVRAKKALGQNFLVDPNYQRRIVAAVGATPDDQVLEIGPGTGALTEHLAGTVRRFIAIEIDNDLAPVLSARYQGRSDVQIVHDDALEVDYGALLGDEPVRIVGNIPYNITTPLVFRLLERDVPALNLVLMVQREVADRIVAVPGGKEYGALSVGVQSVARAERLFGVPRGAFRPVPNVDSAVIRITPFRPPRLTESEEADVRRLTRAAFGWRRKQLQRILRDAPDYGLSTEAVNDVLGAAGIEPAARPETLAPDVFVGLAQRLRSLGLPRAPS